MLMHWGRDRSRGPRLPLEHLIKRQTSETADFFSFSDRGRLAPGLRADINVIDFDNLKVRKPELVHDMPAGGRRFVQRVEGYETTMVAGTQSSSAASIPALCPAGSFAPDAKARCWRRSKRAAPMQRRTIATINQPT